MSKSASSKTETDKRLFLFSLAVFIVVCALVLWQMDGRGANSDQPPIQAAATGVPPTVAMLLTSIPSQLGGGGLYAQIDTLAQQMEACSDYSADRRAQMTLHITWLRNPDQIPRDLLVAMGSESVSRLLLGMSTFTLQEWQARERPPASCLVPIGQMLNTLLVATGQPPAAAFEQ
jgi:hypothetical protein